MVVYISLSLAKRDSLKETVDTIREILFRFGLSSNIFVDRYHFSASEEKEMMLQAMSDIDACDLLIAEVSEKAIGVGLEAGYAKGKGKTVIYLRRSNAEHSTTVSGVSDYQVVYESLDDLKSNLEKIIKLWLSNRT